MALQATPGLLRYITENAVKENDRYDSSKSLEVAFQKIKVSNV